mmetsp:Transcript_6426/g.7217  ORF Transcript_6426/g.7217 Transcript_6426/m.7217 type:complete len:309 (+) Transcript_6426:2-928(+)
MNISLTFSAVGAYFWQTLLVLTKDFQNSMVNPNLYPHISVALYFNYVVSMQEFILQFTNTLVMKFFNLDEVDDEHYFGILSTLYNSEKIIIFVKKVLIDFDKIHIDINFKKLDFMKQEILRKYEECTMVYCEWKSGNMIKDLVMQDLKAFKTAEKSGSLLYFMPSKPFKTLAAHLLKIKQRTTRNISALTAAFMLTTFWRTLVDNIGSFFIDSGDILYDFSAGGIQQLIWDIHYLEVSYRKVSNKPDYEEELRVVLNDLATHYKVLHPDTPREQFFFPTDEYATSIAKYFEAKQKEDQSILDIISENE